MVTAGCPTMTRPWRAERPVALPLPGLLATVPRSVLGRAFVDTDQADDPFKIVDRSELDNDLPLPATDIDPYPGIETVRKPVGEIRQRWRVRPRPALG